MPIGEVSEDGRLDAICPQCRYRFGVLTGTLSYSGRGPEVTAVESTNARTQSAHRNPYELHLVVPGNQRQTVRHSTINLLNWSQARLRHSLAITFTMRGKQVEELLTIHDQTTGDTIKVGRPGQSIRATAWKWAVATFVATLVAAAALLNGSPSAYLLALLAGVAGYYVSASRAAPRVKLTAEEQRRIEDSQSLLAKKSALVEARAATFADWDRKHVIADQVFKLVEKMRVVDEQVYAGRIARLLAACQLLAEQVEIDTALMHGYDRAMAMIDIEVESLSTVGELTGTASASIDAKIAELDALKEEIQERERALVANEELESFLEASNRSALPEGKEPAQGGEYAPGIPLEHLFDEPEDEGDDREG